jgi:beta-lactamase regulating signal transducer with metallopeptidase domain
MMSLLVEAAIRSLILGLAVGLGLRLFKVRNAQAEMTAWIVVLAAALAMPLLMQWPILRLAATSTPLPTIIAGVAAPDFAEAAVSTLPAPSIPASAAVSVSVLPILYGAVAGIMLLRLLAGLAMTGRIVRRARPVEAEWARGVDVRITDEVKAPVTFGRVILLPTAFATWPAAKRQAVMSHERSHIEHHDFAVQVASNLHGALFWFSPLAWWLRVRLSALAETTSDETAIRHLGNRIDYAEILFDIAVNARDLPAGIAMARPAMLRQRVERILSRTVPAVTLAPGRRLALVVGLIPGILLIGGTAWHARADDTPPHPPSPATQQSVATPASDVETRASDAPSFMIFTGDNHMSVNSHGGEFTRMLSAHDRIGGDAIVFTHDGKVFAITDPALIKQAQDLFGPVNELGEQQGKLGEQQSELGRQQGELGRQQGEFGRQMGELGREISKVAAKLVIASGTASLARLEKSDNSSNEDQVGAADEAAKTSADLETQMQGLKSQMRTLGEQMKALGEEQKPLGEKQRELGHEQSKLGKEQTRLSHEATAKLGNLIDQALASGAAVPVP